MKKEIRYNGLTTVPSDYQAPDGDLSLSLNLINEDSALRPLQLPESQQETGVPVATIFIHKTAGLVRYIVAGQDNAYSWADSGDPETLTPLAAIPGFIQITAVGNTLVILTDRGMRYFLWKNDRYLDLGSHLPETNLSFGLKGHMEDSGLFTVSLPDDIPRGTEYSNLYTTANEDAATSQVLAQANQFIANRSLNNGRFIFPFFIRYAYRLYDGSLTMHSAPVLMVTTTGLAPMARISRWDDPHTVVASICAMCCSLDFMLLNPEAIEKLRDWSDIISSVDIFISKPIYTYNQNGRVHHCTRNIGTTLSYCRLSNASSSASQAALAARPGKGFPYQELKFSDAYPAVHGTRLDQYFQMPAVSKGNLEKEIRGTAAFYLLTSVKPKNLPTVRTDIGIPADYFKSLVNREVMTDDYLSHDPLVPRYAFAYNNRLNLADVSRRLYDSFANLALATFTDGYLDIDIADHKIHSDKDGLLQTDIYFFIRENAREYIVEGRSSSAAEYSNPKYYIFYPNVNAFKAILRERSGNGRVRLYEFPMKPHDFLNGAYWFDGFQKPEPFFDSDTDPSAPPVPEPSADLLVDISGKLYTSDVNNPFLFPATGINTIGTGRILAVCAAAKALSQGQFGQFPLYAFTTEGVWALEVSASGAFSARQPITRDVCLDSAAIAQLDNAVLFATSRGIMLISGSQTKCITDMIGTPGSVPISGLPGLGKLHDRLTAGSDSCFPLVPFPEFIRKCRMVYDYVNQRVIIYNPSISYAYVYSLKSGMFGMLHASIANHINSYPEAIAMIKTRNGSLRTVDLSQTSSAASVKALMVTRPLKLDNPDILKTISSVIQRGLFRRGHVSSLLYASRDLIHWFLVWSSRDHSLRGFGGTPFRYFRIALLCDLAPGESISGASVEFTPRLTDRPR